MFVIVRAMAPVAGIPPKSGETIFAMPCPINSVLEWWLSPITPSATVAESSDSMAPSTAIVIAGPTSILIVSHERAGTVAEGRVELMSKRSPMVSMVVTPAYSFSRSTTTVTRMMATSEPGIFFSTRCDRTIITILAMPIPALHGSISPRCEK